MAKLDRAGQARGITAARESLRAESRKHSRTEPPAAPNHLMGNRFWPRG
jgi:hypothetical protein